MPNPLHIHRAAIAALTALVLLPTAAGADSGDLDTDFGAGGVSVLELDETSIYDVAITTDGKTVVAGERRDGIQHDAFVARLGTDGLLDDTFGTDGYVITELGGNRDRFEGVAIQPDGKIVAAGYTFDTGVLGSGDLTVARYDADGTPDTTFDTDGVQFLTLADPTFGYEMALAPDGRIVVAGRITQAGAQILLVARFTSAGNLDTDFDGDGYLATEAGAVSSTAYAVTVLADGSILAAGSDGNHMTVVRHLADGSLDPAFAGDGIFNGEDPTSEVSDILALPSGRILLAGSTYNGSDNDLGVLALNRDGTVDTSFADGGLRVVTLTEDDEEEAQAIAVQPDGRIVATGKVAEDNTGKTSVLAVRLLPDGSLDQTLDDDGIATYLFSDNDDQGEALAIADGRIVVAGPYDNYDRGFVAWIEGQTTRCNGELVTVDLAIGATPTTGDDVILGTPGADVVRGLAGNDVICGVRGNDRLLGGAGDDTLIGAGGRDVLRGRGGADTLRGGKRADRLNGGAGVDACKGGPGRDIERRCE